MYPDVDTGYGNALQEWQRKSSSAKPRVVATTGILLRHALRDNRNCVIDRPNKVLDIALVFFYQFSPAKNDLVSLT